MISLSFCAGMHRLEFIDAATVIRDTIHCYQVKQLHLGTIGMLG